MVLRRLFFVLFLLLIIFGFNPTVLVANTCTGSPSATYTYCECIDSILGKKCSCSTKTDTGSCYWLQTGLGPVCVWDKAFDWTCSVTNGVCVATAPSYRSSHSAPTESGCTTCVTVNGRCGSSNGGSFCDRPTSGLCSSGSVSWTDSVGSDGKWNWKCVGTCSDSTDAYCSATNLPTVNGVCGTNDGTCSSGSVYDVGTTSVIANLGIYSLWNCTGSCSGNNASCSYKLCSSVAGVCETNDGTCSSGSVYDVGTTAIRSDGIYSLWNCNGICGSTSNSSCEYRICSRVDGLCGSANGGNFATAPLTNLCSSGVASPIPVNTNPITFTWSCNGSCSGSNSNCLATRDIAPTFPVPVPSPSPGPSDPAPNPSGGVRLHNCQFPNSNLITINVAVNDANGLGDIGNIYLRFLGQPTEYGPVSLVSGVATFNLDVTLVPDGIYTVQVKADDVHSPITSGWVSLDYQFKKWDCLVNVSGTIYDGSNVPISCSANSGYTTTIPSDLNFDLRYQIGTNAPRIMTVNSPNFLADSNNRLYWNSPVNYQPQLAYFPGTNPTQAKINNACYNTAALDPKIADPYSANPSLSIQYSSILDQEAWYRATGGAIINKGVVTNYIPGTCTTPECRTITGDIILSLGRASLSPYDKSVADNLIYDNREVNLKPYSYDSLKRQYFTVKGYGTTVPSSATWSQLPTKSGPIFVNGNLTIDANIATTDLVMIITKGDITVNPNVTRIDGVLMGNNIIISGKSASQLVINGSIYGIQSVVLNRSFDPKNLNNKTPAVEVKYNPSLIFKLPPKMIQTISQWRLLQ